MRSIYKITIFLGLLIFNNIAKADSLPKLPEFVYEDLERIELELPPKITENIGEKQIWLYKNELAPWNGVLLNPEAAAFIIADRLTLIHKAELALITQRKSDLAKLNLETGKLRLELDALTKKSQIEIQGRDAEIKSCQKVNKQILDDRNHIKRKLFIGMGSGTAGLVIGVLIGLFAF